MTKIKFCSTHTPKQLPVRRTWGIRWDHTYHARVVKDRFDWGDMPQSKKELCDLIIYELHVRDFTHHPSSGVQHRGTFAGLMEKIPYLKELGINAVELMPIFEFDETMNAQDGRRKHTYSNAGDTILSAFLLRTAAMPLQTNITRKVRN